MHAPRNLNKSFVHGVVAFLAYALGPFVHSWISLLVSCIVCVYAGWFRRAYLASFLGGIIVAVVGWTIVGVFFAPGTGVAAMFMVPFALMVMLPIALVGYMIGKGIYVVMHRRVKTVTTDG